MLQEIQRSFDLKDNEENASKYIQLVDDLFDNRQEAKMKIDSEADFPRVFAEAGWLLYFLCLLFVVRCLLVVCCWLS